MHFRTVCFFDAQEQMKLFKEQEKPCMRFEVTPLISEVFN